MKKTKFILLTLAFIASTLAAIGDADYDVVVSDDGKLRLYSRDNGQGGTMRFYDNMLKFQSGGKTHSFDGTIGDYLEGMTRGDDEGDGSGGTYYDELHTIKGNQNTFYLVASVNKLQGGDYGIQWASYTIDDKLKRAALFHKKQEKLSAFFIECHWCDMERLFSYDNREKVLYVPTAKDNYARECAIDKFDKYQWKDDHFEYVESLGKRYWLHPSLRELESLDAEIETERFHIRIDRLGDDNYRYASWPKGRPTTEKPDLIIVNGKRIPNDSGKSHYVFNNYAYSYSCEFGTDNNNTVSGFLIVKKNGKEILKEKIVK